MVRAAIVLLLMTALMQSAAAAPVCPSGHSWPPPFRFEFEVKATLGFLGLSGDNSLVLTRDADRYSLVSETSAGIWFSARQTSSGQVIASGVVPSEYSERNGNKPRADTHLDWTGERVTFSASDKVVPTQPQMQDRLSLLLQLGWAQRARAAGLDLPVAGVRGSSIYRFESRGTETIEIPAGRFQAIKLERPMGADDDRIEVWLAPALCSLPVRIRFADHKGLVINNELRSAKFQ